MVCHALARCRICARKHKLKIYGSQKNQHVLIERINLELIILNTVCVDCIEKFEKIVEKSGDESAGSLKNFEYQGETSECNQTSNNEMLYCVEFNEKTCQTDETFHESPSTFGLEEKFDSIEKKRKCLDEEEKSTTSTVVKDHAQKKLRPVEGMRASSVRRKIFCDFCPKEFTHRGDMKRHKRKHTGERPYECADCLKTFSQLSNLSRHRLVHTGERPFVCEQCGQSYSRKGRLLNHIDRNLCQRKIKRKKI